MAWRQRVILASMASSGRKSIPDPVALSGNQCAFPGCTNAVTDQVAPGEQPVTLAQRAHIVGVGRQGPRSRETPLADDIDAVENLTLFCGEHHRIVDANPRIYSVEVLAKYKADHEARMAPRTSARRHCRWRPTRWICRSCRSPSCRTPFGGRRRCSGQRKRSASTCRGRGVTRFSRSSCSRVRCGHSTTSATPGDPSSRPLTRVLPSGSAPRGC
jgi:hypothetical protein